MHNEFEENFKRDVRKDLAITNSKSKFKLTFVLVIIFAVIAIAEGIALAIILPQYLTQEDTATELADDPNFIPPAGEKADSNWDGESPLIYDDNDNLFALDMTCGLDSSAHFSFLEDRTFQEQNGAETIDQGTYSISNDSLISLTTQNGSNRVLYFDGSFVADGTDIYNCTKND